MIMLRTFVLYSVHSDSFDRSASKKGFFTVAMHADTHFPSSSLSAFLVNPLCVIKIPKYLASSGIGFAALRA